MKSHVFTAEGPYLQRMKTILGHEPTCQATFCGLPFKPKDKIFSRQSRGGGNLGSKQILFHEECNEIVQDNSFKSPEYVKQKIRCLRQKLLEANR